MFIGENRMCGNLKVSGELDQEENFIWMTHFVM